MIGNSSNDGRTAPAWDDLEAFGVIVHGLRAGNTLQQIGEDPHFPFKSARMLYLRLARLERALGKRLVDRRPWGRDARLTEHGQRVAEFVAELKERRRRLDADLHAPEPPTLRLITHATIVSTLLPTFTDRRRRQGKPPTEPQLQLLVAAALPDALAAVGDGHADIGVYFAPPGKDHISLPQQLTGERLLFSDLVVVCPENHRFAVRLRANPHTSVAIGELADETVILREYFAIKLPPPGPRGARITVPHSLDTIAYVRLGLGVGVQSRLVFNLLGPPPGLVALPMQPSSDSPLYLFRPRKRLRVLSPAAEEFIDDLRVFCRERQRKLRAAR